MDQLPTYVFARRLRQERERQGMTQAELARRLSELLGASLDASAVTRIEQTTRAVRLDEAVFAAQVLGVPLIALLAENAGHQNEAAIQEHLAALTAARTRWEQANEEVTRLAQIVEQLLGERNDLRARDTT
jgi:transcriptional regulator with XRE-family HTH domain